ncbi:MAG: GIY-YIG nuclease family protein [Chromatiaceae bacterium]
MTDEKETSDDRPRRLVDLAAELGYSPSSFRKTVRRRGFEPFKLQKGQSKPWYLSSEDAEALRRKLEDERYHRVVPEEETTPTGLSGTYAVEVPAYDGSVRVKIGWSDSITDRLNTYRTIVPDLRVSRIWPCSAKWYEQMALTWAENNGKRVGQEIFEFDDNEASLSALDGLFSSFGIMPQSTGI